MRTSKRRAIVATVSSSPVLVSSPSSSSHSAPLPLPPPSSSSPVHGRHSRFPTRGHPRNCGCLSSGGSGRANVEGSNPGSASVPAATAATVREGKLNRHHARRRQRDTSKEGDADADVGGDAAAVIGFVSLTTTAVSEVSLDAPAYQEGGALPPTGQEVRPKKEKGGNRSHVKNQKKNSGSAQRGGAAQLNAPLRNPKMLSQVWSPLQHSGSSHSARDREHKSDEDIGAVTDRADTQRHTAQNIVVPTASVPSAGAKTTTRSGLSRARNAPKNNRNVKGVTASLAAQRCRDSGGKASSAGRATSPPAPSSVLLQFVHGARPIASCITAAPGHVAPSLSEEGDTNNTNNTNNSSSSSSSSSSSNISDDDHDVQKTSGAVSSPPTLPFRYGKSLPQALCDPAIVEHHMRSVSARTSPASFREPTAAATLPRNAMATLPPDPCVLKVVGVATIVSAAPSPTFENRKGGGKEVWLEAKDTTVATSPPVTTPSSALPPKMSDEDTQLSRRGLRFEAAPWRPSVGLVLDLDDAALASTLAVPMPLPPFPPVNPSTATVVFPSRPVEPLPQFAARVPATDADVAIAAVALTATAVVPAVTITSTLTKEGEGRAEVLPAVAAAATTTVQQQQRGMAEPLTLSPSPTPPSLATRSSNDSDAPTRGLAPPVTITAAPSSSTPPFAAEETGTVSPASLVIPEAATTTTPSNIVVGGGGVAAVTRSSQSLLESPVSAVTHLPATAQPGGATLGRSDGGRSGATHTLSQGFAVVTTSAAAGGWGGAHSLSPSSVLREDDRENSSGTSLLSPGIDPATDAASTASAATTTTTMYTAAAAAAAPDRPATAPAIRRSAMTVTNTATGARMSSSTLTTSSGSPMGQWAVVEGVGGGGVHWSSGPTAAAGAAALTPSWTSSNSPVHGTAGRSVGSVDCGMREFPAMPFPSSFSNVTTATRRHSPLQQQQQQQRGCNSLSSFGAGGGGSNRSSTELVSGAAGMNPMTVSSAAGPTTTMSLIGGGAAGSHSGSSYPGSPQLSLPNSSSLPLGGGQLPRNGLNTSPASGVAGGTTGGTGNGSLSLLFPPSHFGLSPPTHSESDVDRVRHNRVAVSDTAAKNEITLVDTLFADDGADVVEDDESEMDMDDGSGGGGAASGAWWPAYEAGSGGGSDDTSRYLKQQPQQHGYASSPTASGVGATFGGGYWYQPGSSRAAGQQLPSGGGSASRPRFCSEDCVRRAISASCASVASSTMSLLDPKQPNSDLGPAAYAVGDGAEEEEEWEMNSSAYADSLDEAQIQWIEEQLKATENPVGYF